MPDETRGTVHQLPSGVDIAVAPEASIAWTCWCGLALSGPAVTVNKTASLHLRNAHRETATRMTFTYGEVQLTWESVLSTTLTDRILEEWFDEFHADVGVWPDCLRFTMPDHQRGERPGEFLDRVIDWTIVRVGQPVTVETFDEFRTRAFAVIAEQWRLPHA